MSGAILNGVRIELDRCCHCGAFVPVDELEYGPSFKYPAYDAVDLCQDCQHNLKGEQS